MSNPTAAHIVTASAPTSPTGTDASTRISQHNLTILASRSLPHPANAASATHPFAPTRPPPMQSNTTNIPSSSPPLSAASSGSQSNNLTYLLLPAALSSRPRSRSLGAVHPDPNLKQPRSTGGRTRTTAVQPVSAADGIPVGLPPRSAAVSAFNQSPGAMGGAFASGSSIFGVSVGIDQPAAAVLSPTYILSSTFEMSVVPELGGRAQSAAHSQAWRPAQTQSATSSPQAADNDFLPLDSLDPIGMGEYEGGLGNYMFSDSSMMHPEGGLGSGTGSSQGGGINTGDHPDEIDLALMLVKLVHERSSALELKVGGGRGRSGSKGERDRRLSTDKRINRIEEEEQMNLTPPTFNLGRVHDSVASNMPTLALPSSSLYPSPSLVPSIDEFGRPGLAELSLMNRQLEKITALLYKSKLSLSLRTVQLRRHMRSQFLSDLNHPARPQTVEDVEVLRWIASSALSNLEIAESTQGQPGGTDSTNEELTTDEDHTASVDDGEFEPMSPSPVDLAVRTPVASRQSSLVMVLPPISITAPPSFQPSPSPLPPPVPVPSPAVDFLTSLPSAPNFPPAQVLSPATTGIYASTSPPLVTSALSPSVGAISVSFAAAPVQAPTNSPGPTTPQPVSTRTFTSSLSVSGSMPSLSEARSATPIVTLDDVNIANLIGAGFNSKRGSGAVSALATPAAGAGIRRSSTSSDPIKHAGKETPTQTYTTSPSLPSRTRPSVTVGAVLVSSGSPSAGPVASAGQHSPVLPPAASPPVPLTAVSLVADPPANRRSVSHPSSPALPGTPASALSTPPSGASTSSRSISENRARKDSVSTGRRSSRIYFTLTPLVTEALHKVWEWKFDIWEFVELVPDTPLSTIACYLLERWCLFQTFNIDRATFHRFISKIEEGYIDNAYHNRIHAADVVQNIHVLLLGFMQKPQPTGIGALCTSLTPLDVLCCIIAAAIHDYKHPGTTNIFHTNTVSDLAIRYNDVSVLENMHLAEAFELIFRHKEYDIFATFTREQRREARESIIQCVLATDMKNHISMLTDLQATVESKRARGEWFDVSSRTDRLLLMKNALHLSDVANPTKPTSSCVRWADCISREWFIQGDKERSLKLDISPMMDRFSANVPKSQIGFIDFFITPLYNTWSKVTPLTSIALDFLRQNRQYWQARLNHNNNLSLIIASAANQRLKATQTNSNTINAAPTQNADHAIAGGTTGSGGSENSSPGNN